MQENKGFYQLMEQLPQERLLIAVHSIAGSEAMFELTRDWVRERKAFGRRVADLQTGPVLQNIQCSKVKERV